MGSFCSRQFGQVKQPVSNRPSFGQERFYDITGQNGSILYELPEHRLCTSMAARLCQKRLGSLNLGLTLTKLQHQRLVARFHLASLDAWI